MGEVSAALAMRLLKDVKGTSDRLGGGRAGDREPIFHATGKRIGNCR